jgi:hypothetical protein
MARKGLVGRWETYQRKLTKSAYAGDSALTFASEKDKIKKEKSVVTVGGRARDRYLELA